MVGTRAAGLPCIATLLLAVWAGVLPAGAQEAREQLGYHAIRTDARGRLVPWFSPKPSVAYDDVVRRVWRFWRDMRSCPNGVKYYLQHQVWKPGEDDPRGLGGDQLNMALSSWSLLYGYLGDPAVKRNMLAIADYWIGHGLSPAGSLWPNLPYPYNTGLHSGVYDGDMRAGKGFLQPDKAASFGAELLTLYKMTGNRRYLDVAVGIADTLALRVTPGDATHSPWPYRVYAGTGAVHRVEKDGRVFEASYTTNWTGALRLFDGLIALGKGRVPDYRRAGRLVTAWLKAYPLKTNNWGPFFEDIPTEVLSNTETNADTLAAFILEHPGWDPGWRSQAKGILDWSLRTFGNSEWTKYGVVPINEQTAYLVPGNSHTSRHASVELLYGEKTGDWSAKGDAVARLSWATYMVDTDGKNRYPRDDIWLTDGYGDYVRHYLRAMASAPELAPDDQNHLLRTTSVIRSITYSSDAITYTKHDARSRERLKLGAWPPGRVVGATYTWNPDTRVLEVRSRARTVRILRLRPATGGHAGRLGQPRLLG